MSRRKDAEIESDSLSWVALTIVGRLPLPRGWASYGIDENGPIEPRMGQECLMKSFLAFCVQAEAIDRRLQNGESIGPLAGVPVAIKVRSKVFDRLSCRLPSFRG